MIRQPWDVPCPTCRAKRKNVCRTLRLGKSLKMDAHESRWNKSLGLKL